MKSKRFSEEQIIGILKQALPASTKGRDKAAGGNMIIANRYIRILIATICVFLSMAVIAYAIEDYNKAIQLNPNDAAKYDMEVNAND
jgi:uncharacterized membrane protein